MLFAFNCRNTFNSDSAELLWRLSDALTMLGHAYGCLQQFPALIPTVLLMFPWPYPLQADKDQWDILAAVEMNGAETCSSRSVHVESGAVLQGSRRWPSCWGAGARLQHALTQWLTATSLPLAVCSSRAAAVVKEGKCHLPLSPPAAVRQPCVAVVEWWVHARAAQQGTATAMMIQGRGRLQDRLDMPD